MAVLIRNLLVCGCVVWLSACAHSLPIVEYLDTSTAATIRVAKTDWVFARSRTQWSMNARDYITLTPVLSNRSGKRELYLHCQIWSTVDRYGAVAIASEASLQLVANDRVIPLAPHPKSPRELGFGQAPIMLANAKATVRWVPIDKATLDYIVHAEQLRIATENESDVFELWRSPTSGVLAFLQQSDLP
jgi:hypothetical protein